MIVVALAAASLVPGANYNLARPHGARMSPEDAARRFLQLGCAFDSPCAIVIPPYYQVRELPFASAAGFHRRRIWQGTVQANGKLLNLVMNDNTGNLMYAFSPGPRPEGDVVAPIETPVGAARTSLAAAQRLQMIPKGAEVALEGDPERYRRSDGWRVAWRVRRTPGASPFLLRVQVTGQDGRIMSAANAHELADFAEH